MARSTVRVADLASRADLDLEEAIVALWDAGFEDVSDPEDAIPARRVRDAENALAIRSYKEELRVDYWLARTGLTREQFAAKLADVGVVLSPSTRKLPKGSLRRTRALFDIGLASPPERRREGPPTHALAPLVWEIVGKVKTIELLDEEQVIRIHEQLEEDFAESADPIFPPGVRDSNLLSSALTRPRTGLGTNRKYPTVEMATAALFHSLIHNHPFHNGNKRTALVAMLAMLDRNDNVLTYNEEELFRFTLRTAQHSLVPMSADSLPDREVLAIARWIKSGIRDLVRGERPLKWIRLRQILVRFGCTCQPAPGVGNRLMISRTVLRARKLRAPRQVVFSSQVAWSGDGTEAERNTIHKIRHDLELDESHGVDSATFYSGEAIIDSFIVEYCNILKRLARL